MHVELVRLRFGKKKMQKQLWVLSMKMQLWLKKIRCWMKNMDGSSIFVTLYMAKLETLKIVLHLLFTKS